MPPQTRAAQGFAGVAVEIDLTHKGCLSLKWSPDSGGVEIDLTHKGIMTQSP